MSAIARSRVEVAERMTAADFWRDAPEKQKTELIDGVMTMHSPASYIHEDLFGFLLSLLREFVENRNLGKVLGSRTAVELAPNQVYEPDILFVARARLGIIQSKGIVGAPDFVIEILSASTAAYDRGSKLRGYERAGVTETWLTDPYGPAGTEFYRLEGGIYVPVVPDANGILRSVAVPGFWIDVNWLWPEGKFISVREALERINKGKAQ